MYFYNMFMYLVGTILPLAFQLSSLIFGLIRKKKKDKFKLKLSELEQDPTNQSESDKFSKKGSTFLNHSGMTNDFFDPPLEGNESEEDEEY